jgi:hypothetical protein
MILLQPHIIVFKPIYKYIYLITRNDRKRKNSKGRWFNSLSRVLKTTKVRKRFKICYIGGYAECFVAERTNDKKKYALKIIPKAKLQHPKARQKVNIIFLKVLSEIKLHRQAKHKNICELEKAF